MPEPWIWPADAAEAVADWTGVPCSELLKGLRASERTTRAKRLLWGVLRDLGLSYTEIGRLSRNHHSSVMTGLALHPPDPDEVRAVIEKARARI